jgi:hypothetical protein
MARRSSSDELVRVMDDIRSEGERLKAETTKLNDMRVRLSGLLETKKQSLAERETELKQVRKAAADIAESVNDLNELIAKLDREMSKSSPLARRAWPRRRLLRRANQEQKALWSNRLRRRSLRRNRTRSRRRLRLSFRP